MTGHETVQQAYNGEITAHHGAVAAVERDPFIDRIPATAATSAAEVPHLKELAENAVPALPVDPTTVTLRAAHVAAQHSQEVRRPAA
jgi:hypothetical protein